ncbi:MAG: hypothetical protein AABX70_04130 [Nanoarchaeota archaeon]
MIDYVLIRGPIGVGKTSVAKRFSNLLSLDCYPSFFIEFDRFRRELGIGEPTYLNKRVGTFLLVERMNQLIQKGSLPVVEGVFYEGNMNHLRRNITGLALLIKLMAPLDICIERDQRRTYPRGVERVVPVWNSLQHTVVSEVSINTETRTIEEIVDDVYLHFKSVCSTS